MLERHRSYQRNECEKTRETFCLDWAKHGESRCATLDRHHAVEGEEEWALDLCLSLNRSFDLEAGKDVARNKCLGHDILSM